MIFLEKETLHKLENYLSRSDKNNVELSHILADLCAEKVIRAALPFYDEFLRDRRNGQDKPLNLDQVIDIVNGMFV